VGDLTPTGARVSTARRIEVHHPPLVIDGVGHD
jgi:hypothetical protein